MVDEQGDAVFRSRKFELTKMGLRYGSCAWLLANIIVFLLRDKLPPMSIGEVIGVLLFDFFGLIVCLVGGYSTANVAQKAADWWTGRRG